MPEVILSAELQANINNWRANLVAAAAEVNRTGQAAQTASNNITQNMQRVNAINLGGFTRSLQQGEISLRNIGTTSATVSTNASRGLAQIAAASAMTGRSVAAGSNQAAFALTNLGRVAQDAPFGFIGIQNNLNPLLESFQRLRAETGSNGAAFRALGQSLIGPAGIGIALSVITSAITFYMMYQQRANKATKDAKKDTDDYINSLDQLSQVQVKGAQNAQKDITELNTLYAITQNTTLSLKQRTEAVDELQKKYPEYFKNLKDETVLNGGAKDAYDRLTVSIIATARARAAQDLITKNSSRQLENEQKLIDLETESNKLALQASKLRKDAEDEIGGQRNLLLNKAVGAEAKRLEIYRLQNNLKTDSNLLDDKNLKLTEAITEQVKKGADLFGKVGDEAKTKNVKTLSDVMKDLAIDLQQVDAEFNLTFGEKSVKKIDAYQTAISSLIKLGYDPATDAVKKLQKAQQDLFQLPELKEKNRPSAVDPKSIPKNYLGNDKGVVFDRTTIVKPILDEEHRKILEAQVKFNEDFAKLAESGITSSLGNMAEAIGEAFASGGDVLSAIGNSVLETFSGFLSKFGDLLVEYGAAAVLKGKLDLAIATPGAGIVAGFAAIAAGIALKVAAGALGSFASGKGSSSGNFSSFNESPVPMANGAIAFGPTHALVGEYSGARNNPEVIAPLDKLKSMLGNTGNSGIQLIPIANNRELAIMVKYGNEELNRQ